VFIIVQASAGIFILGLTSGKTGNFTFTTCLLITRAEMGTKYLAPGIYE
jgi:hypothetical protein